MEVGLRRVRACVNRHAEVVARLASQVTKMLVQRHVCGYVSPYILVLLHGDRICARGCGFIVLQSAYVLVSPVT